MPFLKLSKRIVNRVAIILRDLYIDFAIQKRLIGNKTIKSINPDRGISKWQNTSYDALNHMLLESGRFKIKPNDVIIDVGCADGKPFNILLYHGVKNMMIGYEINVVRALKVKQSLKNYPNVHIICDDIFEDFPTTGTIFYLFNPFGEELMKKFVQNIFSLKSLNPIVVYNNPLHADLFNGEIFDTEIIPFQQYRFGDGKYAIIKFKKHV
jgi:hypothetical protein